MTTSELGVGAAVGFMTDSGAIYGPGFGSVYSTSRYTAFSEKLARLAVSLIERHGAPGRRLLDLACGVGAGTRTFAISGFDVSGVDASEEMVRRAGEQAVASGSSVRFECQDMRCLRLREPLDVVTCMFDALNYLIEEEDLARTFRAIASHLRPGGLFVFDMNTPHGLATRWGTRDVLSTSRPDIVEINQHRYDAATRTNSTITTIFLRACDGSTDLYRRYVEVHRERGYDVEFLVELLRAAGMTTLSIDGVADMTHGLRSGLVPVADDAGRVIIAARRSDNE